MRVAPHESAGVFSTFNCRFAIAVRNSGVAAIGAGTRENASGELGRITLIGCLEIGVLDSQVFDKG